MTTINLSSNQIGDDGVKSLSTALMNENNKVTTLSLDLKNVGTPGLASFLKNVRFSLVNRLYTSSEDRLHHKARNPLRKFTNAFNQYLARLDCLASVRTIPRIGSRTHVRMLSSDILIRVVQTLGWFIDLKETIRVLEGFAD